MTRFMRSFGSAGLLAATAIGAGMFALPALFAKAGWGVGLIYLVSLGLVSGYSHYLYYRVQEQGNGSHLLGFVHARLGRAAYAGGMFVITGGLVLGLVVYLILAASFLRLIVPGFPFLLGASLFWLAGSLPLFMKMRWLVDLELAGTAAMVACIIGIAGLFGGVEGFSGVPIADASYAALPFGAVLLSYAAWTAVPAMVENDRRSRRADPVRSIVLGTLVAGAAYALFSFSLLGSGREIAEDAVSGFVGSPLWERALIGILGLFTIWTSYVPIALESVASFRKDIRLPAGKSVLLVLALPLLVVTAGFQDFLAAVSFSGGVFLSLQYLLILAVAQKTLRLTGVARSLTWSLMAVFALAALLEIYYVVT